MATIDTAIVGSAGLLAAHIVALQRARSHSVGYLAAAAEFTRFAELLDSLARADACMKPLQRLSAPHELAGAHVWYFVPTTSAIERSWLEAMRQAGVAALNIVESPYCGGQRWRWLLPNPDAADSGDPFAAGIAPLRRFRTTLTISAAPHHDIAQEGVLHFLATLFDLKSEIDERVDDFFEYRALRCSIAPEASVNVLPVERAAAMIEAIAEGRHDGDFPIAAANDMTGEEFLGVVGDVFGVSLIGSGVAPQDIAETSVDGLFDRRLMNFSRRLAQPSRAAAARSWALAGITPDEARLDRATFKRLVVESRRRQEAAHRTLATRAAAASTSSNAAQVRRAGRELAYVRTGGNGRTVALINAIGQGLHAWTRLAELLSPQFRVLSWELRGLDGAHPAMSVADHVSDLSAILDEEGVDDAHLVAWCTGPKIAIEFARRFPARVRSLVLLNTTMKGAGTPSALDTLRERNLESLCRILVQQPGLAASVMDSLIASAQVAEENLLERDPKASSGVLAVMNRDLRQAVLRPFRDPLTLTRYARQLTEFWTVDVRKAASALRVPVLLLASEFDRVTTSESSQWAAQLFPNARLLRVPGATHYLLYDRADVVARAIEWFTAAADS